MKKYILIADPSKLSRFVMENILKGKYTVYSVSSYSEAVTLLEEVIPSLVVVAYELQDGLGYELCNYINNNPRFQNIPVIIMSSNEDSERYRIKALESGAIDFIKKSTIDDSFIKYVDEIVEILSAGDISDIIVFVVDDSNVQLKFVENVLKSVRVNVSLFSSPIEMLERIKDYMPDIVITDFFMGEMDGIELTRSIRKNRDLKYIPIIVQTSTRENSFLRTLIIHGANDYLLKPYSQEELILKITSNYKTKKLYDELQKINRELFERATIDSLTGLYNRRFFMEQFQFMFINSKRYRQDYAFFIIDIDFFKKINDTYGHTVGDIVLVNFAETLKSSLRKSDLVGRFGGEEFVCLLTNINKTGVLMVMHKILANIRSAFVETDSNLITYTVSIGGVFCLEIPSIDEIISTSDDLLYKAKNSGRNKGFFSFEGQIIEVN